jgi:hypothetical protein
MNNTDTDGDGVGDLYGICLNNGPSPSPCKVSLLLFAMAAPYLQYKGTAQGAFFDPGTMAPLADSVAMAQAVRHYLDLWALQPETGLTCSGSNAFFQRGRCLMTINSGGISGPGWGEFGEENDAPTWG